MYLLLIRHGESEADLLEVHEGRADFSLTPRGLRQARAMAQWVSTHYPPALLYSSPLRRAHQTADALAAACGLSIQLDPDLMEYDNGLLAGLPRKEAAAKYPPVVNMPIHRANYQMESALAFRCRAEKVLSTLLSTHKKDGLIAVVSHGGMINQLYHAFFALPIATPTTFASGDTGLHLWRIEASKRSVLFMNRLEHLVVHEA